MPNIRFARFLVIESIPPGQAQSGRQLFESLEPLIKEINVPIAIDYSSIPNRTSLDDLLHDVRADSLRTQRIPLLHFECHGNDVGIELASGQLLHGRGSARTLRV